MTTPNLHELEHAVVGDVLTWSGSVRVVREHCGEPTATFGFFCLLCRCQLANLYQLELHLETVRAPHSVARVCKYHDLETLAPASSRQA